MKTTIVVTVLTVLLSGIAQAAPSKSVPRVPSSVPAQGFKLDVKVGDKLTQFVVWSDKSGKYFNGTDGIRSKSQKISDRNYKFLTTESSKIVRMPSSSVKSCPRSVMMISSAAGKKSQAVCVEATNETAKKMKGMANLMSLLM
jgi:hypothetical protein